MSEIKDLPKGWQMEKLGEVLDIQGGSQPPKSNFIYEPKDGYIQLLQIRDFGQKGLPTYVPKKLVTKFCRKDDILIARYGASLGRIVTGNEGAYNVALAKIIDEKGVFEKRFIFYLFKTQIFQTPLAMLSRSAQNGFSKGEIAGIELPIPPLFEQQLIVSKIEELLSDLDNGKQQLITAQQQLKVYRQSLLKWAFEGKLTQEWRTQQTKLPSAEQIVKKIKSERDEIISLKRIKQKPVQSISDEAFEELEKLPKGMAWVKLGEILWSVKDGPHYSPKYHENGVPFISGGNIRPDGIDFNNVKFISNELHEELSRRCKPEKGDVLYTKGGTTGIARVNNYDIDFNIWVHVAVLKLIPSINPFYLQHVLNSNYCYKQSQKYTHGVGNQDLGLTRMINITLPICTSEEQVQIVQVLESKLTVCNKIEETISQSLQQAETLRQSILKTAFEGKLINHTSDSHNDQYWNKIRIATEEVIPYRES